MAVPENRRGQFSALLPYIAAFMPTWLPAEDGMRIAAYRFYNTLYWNDYGEFQLTIRGDEDFPVYVPSARRIINTFSRYSARACKYSVTAGSTGERDEAILQLDTLFRRERFWTMFHAEKKRGSIRGDWVWMISGDASRMGTGRALSISAVDPEKYFVLSNPEDKSDKWGCAIIQLVTIGEKDYVSVQRWLKPAHPEHPNYTPPPTGGESGSAGSGELVAIAYESVLLEQENWDDPQKRKIFRVNRPLALLDGITALPLYHIRTNVDDSEPYGVSDLRGIERIFLAINQTATDQDVAIAMAGLGMYVADSSPVDSTGAITNWVLGPKRVVEVPQDGTFQRVTGVSSVEPTISHMDWLQAQSESLFGINDIALGDAEVAVAESGIALALRMGPLLDATADRDREIGDVLTNFFFDLKQWLLIYERVNLPTAEILPVFPDKLPVDIDKRLEQYINLATNGIVDQQWVLEQLQILGVDVDPAEILARMAAASATELPSGDEDGDRLGTEAEPDEVGDED